ncbi:MAG: RNA polymerase sigma factor [Thermoanaerobaculia bacterium]|nr:RNA polymerase sigma factor [Thermoanaerobaculia bacterium]
MELELLVTRCQLGEQQGFDQLVERWHPPLWAYVSSMTGDPAVAEEVLQEGWLRILRGIGRLREPARLQAWLYSIVRRTFMDRLRDRYRLKRFEPIDEEPPGVEPPADLDWEERDHLQRSVGELSLADRETLVLFYLRELQLEEVAEILDIPIGTVKSRLHRARRALRKSLTQKGVQR